MQLTHIIRETRYLDRMTFTIPEYALNVTLQEDRYLQCVDGLTDMLERYCKVRPPLHAHATLHGSTPCRLHASAVMSGLQTAVAGLLTSALIHRMVLRCTCQASVATAFCILKHPCPCAWHVVRTQACHAGVGPPYSN